MSAPLARIRGGIHTSIKHDSAVGHVTGSALYLDDVPAVPGTLEAALVLSPHAHARIKSIDVSAALRAPGVAAVITAADIPGLNDIAPIKTNEPLLPVDLVEHEGQPVVAIAAQTLDQARAAAKLVKIDYEPLPAILTVEDAMAKRELRFAAADHGAWRPCRNAQSRAASAVRRTARRRAGSLLSRRPDRGGDAGRGRHHARPQLDPASDRGAARRRASARRAVQRGDRRGAAHGRRVRRQGEPGDHHRRPCRGAGAQGAAAGEAAAAARRRHARHRQAPSVLHPLRGRLRR